MADVNWLTLIWEVFWRVIELANALYNFLFWEFNLLGLEISLWAILGGAAITTILVARLVKLITPLL